MCSFNTSSMPRGLQFFSLLTAWMISSAVIGKLISSFIGLLWSDRSGTVSFSSYFCQIFSQTLFGPRLTLHHKSDLVFE